jgi:glycosyltransferase involved in cell wall biosynthesis
VVDEMLFARNARRALMFLGAPVDVVLCHGHGSAALAGRPFCRATGATLAMFVHADINDRPPGTYDRRLTAFYRWVTPRAYAASDVVMVLSQSLVRHAEAGGAKKVVVIPNGVDPEELGPVSRRDRDDLRLRLLYVGRLAVEKGVDVLIDACRLLDSDGLLDIIGSGPLENQLRARASDRVRFLPPKRRNELAGEYSTHDVFCIASKSEPFGLVVAEALACGLPVVATRTGGLTELVVDGVNGLLVPPGDAAAFARAISRLAHDPALRERLAANARPSVLPRLHWSRIGDDLAAALRDVVETGMRAGELRVER